MIPLMQRRQPYMEGLTYNLKTAMTGVERFLRVFDHALKGQTLSGNRLVFESFARNHLCHHWHSIRLADLTMVVECPVRARDISRKYHRGLTGRAFPKYTGVPLRADQVRSFLQHAECSRARNSKAKELLLGRACVLAAHQTGRVRTVGDAVCWQPAWREHP